MLLKSKFKYRINYYLRRLPKGLSPSDFAFLLKLDYEVSRKDFNGDRKMKMDDFREVPEERLKIYALMFQIDMEQLKGEGEG